MTEIPRRLRSSDYRFVEVAPMTKSPRVRGWQNENARSIGDPRLEGRLAQGWNYAVVMGFGGLIGIDCDDPGLEYLIESGMPRTLKVRSGSGGAHYYYLCPELDGSKPLEFKGRNIGHVRGPGGCLIGPGSMHPNGNVYRVERDIEVHEICLETIEGLFESFIKDKEVNPSKSHQNAQKGPETPEISILEVMDTSGFKRSGDQLQGPHPVHGSSTGYNFCIDPSKNVWHCFRHGTGGGPLELVAMLEGILYCEDCLPGCLRGNRFVQTLEFVRHKYGVGGGPDA